RLDTPVRGVERRSPRSGARRRGRGAPRGVHPCRGAAPPGVRAPPRGNDAPMGRAVFVVPGGLDRISGGNVYDLAAIAAMRERGWEVAVRDPGDLDPETCDLAIIDSLAFRSGRPQQHVPYVALAHQIPSAVVGY